MTDTTPEAEYPPTGPPQPGGPQPPSPHPVPPPGRRFDLGDILSVTTGYLVSRRGVNALYDVMNFMTGDNLFTHQLPRAMEECKPAILAQHPDLAEVVVPDKFDDDHHVWSWLERQIERFGDHRDIAPLAVEDHTFIDPITELQMNYPDKPIIAISLGNGDV